MLDPFPEVPMPNSILPRFTTSFYAPFSGDVVQNIEPRLFSPDIAGDPEVEERIHRNVASYGKQLGKILEALDILATEANVELPEIRDMIERIEAEKSAHRETLKREAEEALTRLKAADQKAWGAVMAKQSTTDADT